MKHMFNFISHLSVPSLLRAVLSLTALTGLLVLFKPLLVGIAHALLLVVRPHLSKEERRARRTMRDRQMLQQMIASSHGPSHAAELRALACRA